MSIDGHSQRRGAAGPGGVNHHQTPVGFELDVGVDIRYRFLLHRRTEIGEDSLHLLVDPLQTTDNRRLDPHSADRLDRTGVDSPGLLRLHQEGYGHPGPALNHP